jgi:hypothetical protein
VARTALSIAIAALVVAFAFVTPPGEAPDEPAHVHYIRSVMTTHALPSIAPHYDFENYEAHQPPLAYVAGAIALRFAGATPIVFTPSPQIDFVKPGSRAVAPPITDPAQVRTMRILRIAQLPFVLIAVAAMWALLNAIAPTGEARWLGAAYLLTPQLLFVFSAVNNDAAAIAFSSVVLLLLVRLLQQPSTKLAAWSGIATAAALFSKATTLFLLAPIAFVILILMRWRQTKAAIVLCASTTAGLAAWLALNLWRFGALLPPVPSSGGAEPLSRLFAEPRWLGLLFRSFWAKFGWLNTPMPAPVYLWFAILTIVAAIGMIAMLRRRESHLIGAMLTIAVMANFAFVLAFMIRVDWQPQGRYLLTSIAALAAWGAAATEAFPPRVRRTVAMTGLVIALCTAIGGVVTVAYWY